MKTCSTVGALASALMLLTAPAASAESYPEPMELYPSGYNASVSPNVAVIAYSTAGQRLSGLGASLQDDQQREVPIDVTEGIDAYGSVMVRPRTPLARGRYSVSVSGASTRLWVEREVDTEPPSAVTELNLMVDSVSNEEFLEFPAPSDNLTTRSRIAYSVYTAPVPELPDTKGPPALVAAMGSVLSLGQIRLLLMRGGGCIAAFPHGTTGRFNVSVRTRDEAGNLGPASPVVELDTEKLPGCKREDEGGGCSALPAPALAAVALWLRRRRRTHG